MTHSRPKIAVGMSGGVDSSVAAALLREKGYHVMGVSMRISGGSGVQKRSGLVTCAGSSEEANIKAAESVCRDLGIAFHVIDLREEYRLNVIEYFRNEHLAGRTPNPCIVCNHRVKFGFFPEKARESGIDFDLFATGHYARIVKKEDRFLLKRAVDSSKDQTYFLCALTQEQLAQTQFPVGDHTKQQVRDLARAFGLKTADRPESQDFLTGGDHAPFFAGKEIKKGAIVDEKGNILGEHGGIIHYTVGQRRGLGIASDRPLYVLGINAGKNQIVLGDKEGLYAKGLMTKDLNLVAIERLDRSCKVKVKIRLRHRGADATVFPCENNDEAKVLFDEPQMSVTPGQYAVLYSGDIVLGGGVIAKAI